MGLDYEAVAIEALKLPPLDRVRLAERLLADQADGESDLAAIDAKWDEEAARRLHELRSGQVKAVPSEDVFASIRAQLAPQ